MFCVDDIICKDCYRLGKFKVIDKIEWVGQDNYYTYEIKCMCGNELEIDQDESVDAIEAFKHLRDQDFV